MRTLNFGKKLVVGDKGELRMKMFEQKNIICVGEQQKTKKTSSISWQGAGEEASVSTQVASPPLDRVFEIIV